jgi:hypothetical protein
MGGLYLRVVLNARARFLLALFRKHAGGKGG